MPILRSTTLRALALALLALGVGPILSWAILVSPHAVFIDSRTRTGQVYLINTGTTAEEVDVELRFGFPETDSTGEPTIRMMDQPGPEFPSAAGWIFAYPRRAVVQPGRRQVVRLLAQPPADLPPGEYWSRLIVTSRGAEVAVSGADSTVRAGVSLIVQTISSVSYRNGDVSTGVTLDDYRADVQGDSIVAWVGLTRQGNAAYLGTIWIRLRNAQNRVVAEWDTPIAAYYRIHRRLAFAVDSVAAGRYAAELEVTTARSDLPQSNILPAQTMRQVTQVEKR
jgi:hypothetical protein